MLSKDMMASGVGGSHEGIPQQLQVSVAENGIDAVGPQLIELRSPRAVDAVLSCEHFDAKSGGNGTLHGDGSGRGMLASDSVHRSGTTGNRTCSAIIVDQGARGAKGPAGANIGGDGADHASGLADAVNTSGAGGTDIGTGTDTGAAQRLVAACWTAMETYAPLQLPSGLDEAEMEADGQEQQAEAAEAEAAAGEDIPGPSQRDPHAGLGLRRAADWGAVGWRHLAASEWEFRIVMSQLQAAEGAGCLPHWPAGGEDGMYGEDDAEVRDLEEVETEDEEREEEEALRTAGICVRQGHLDRLDPGSNPDDAGAADLATVAARWDGTPGAPGGAAARSAWEKENPCKRTGGDVVDSLAEGGADGQDLALDAIRAGGVAAWMLQCARAVDLPFDAGSSGNDGGGDGSAGECQGAGGSKGCDPLEICGRADGVGTLVRDAEAQPLGGRPVSNLEAHLASVSAGLVRRHCVVPQSDPLVAEFASAKRDALQL